MTEQNGKKQNPQAAFGRWVIFGIAALAGLTSCSTTSKETVLFYDVPLACSAVPEIGCGIEAKPILVELQKHDGVQEAWLNRTGSVLAVVGKPSTDNEELAATVEQFLTQSSMRATRMSDEEQLSGTASDFRAEGKWYRGSLVDLLSVEEARTVAVNALGHIQEAGLLSEDEVPTVRADINSYFEKEADAVRAQGELTATNEQWYADMIGILEQRVGKERAAKIRKFHEEHQAGQ